MRASDPRFALHGAERLLVAGRAVWFYLGSLAWPARVSSIRVGHSTPATPRSGRGPRQLGVLVAAFLLRKRLGRAPFAVMLLFCGTLVPALSFFDVSRSGIRSSPSLPVSRGVPVLVGMSACAAPWLAQRLPRGSLGLLALLRRASGCAGTHSVRIATSIRCGHTRSRRTRARRWRSSISVAPRTCAGIARRRRNCPSARSRSIRRATRRGTTSARSPTRAATASPRAPATRRRSHTSPMTLRRATTSVHLGGRPRDRARALGRGGHRPHTSRRASHLVWALHDCGSGTHSPRRLRAAAVADHVATRERTVLYLVVQRWQQAASNAMVWLRAAPSSTAARQQLVATMAQVLLAEPKDRVRLVAESACRNGGVDAGVILPLVEAALRQLGAAGHADALRGGR